VIFFLPAMFWIFSILAKRLAEKSIPKMTYLVLSGTLNLNSVNQFGIIGARIISFIFTFQLAVSKY